jgi:hypothetical protein
MTKTLSHPIEPHIRTIDGLSIRYAESEPRDDHALLLSPWPESIYSCEPIWNRLAEHTHLLAIDLPGFGQSERRNSLMSPRAMGEFVVRVADAFGLKQPRVAGPTSEPERRSSQTQYFGLVNSGFGAKWPSGLTRNHHGSWRMNTSGRAGSARRGKPVDRDVVKSGDFATDAISWPFNAIRFVSSNGCPT